MNPLLFALLGSLLGPLFVGSWRVSLFGFSCQGALMAALAYGLHPQLSAAERWLEFADLAIVRGVAVPGALYAVLRARGMPAGRDIIPPNLLSWTIALAMVLVSFRFAGRLVPEAGEPRALVAVAASGVLLGFLVLATRSDPWSQVIGALRIENAIALVELGSDHHALDLGVRVGLLAVFVATVALFGAHLLQSSATAIEIEDPPEGPTL